VQITGVRHRAGVSDLRRRAANAPHGAGREGSMATLRELETRARRASQNAEQKNLAKVVEELVDHVASLKGQFDDLKRDLRKRGITSR
jgi:hypothetical protein